MIEVTPTIEKVFRPNEGRQTVFLSLPDTIFEALYGGAAGGGKSMALMLLPILRGFHEHSKFHGLILRRTYPELEEYMILRSPEFYEPAGGKYDKTQRRWRFKSGATIKFGHCEGEQDVRKYDTSEYNYIAFDELTSFTEFQYRFLAFSRCRSASDLPAIVRSGSNPGNIGHGWVRDRFVEPCRTGMKILAEQTPNGAIVKRIYIPAKATDNPHLQASYVAGMQLLPEAEKLAKLDGDWWTFSGQVFSEFRSAHFPDEPANALHVCDPPFIPAHIPRILAIDWGYEHMTYALFAAVLPSQRVVTTGEYSCKKKTVKEWANDIAKLCIKNPPSAITMDPSAWQNRGQEGAISDQFSAAWEKVFNSPPPLVQADNDRIGGKMLLHDFLRWKNLPDFEVTKFDNNKAMEILGREGLSAYKNYLGQFAVKPRKEVLLPRLLISKDCHLLIDVLPKCVYDKKKVEDVAKFEGDDPYDTLRYLIKLAQYLFDSSGMAEVAIQDEMQVVAANEKLAETGDMTSYYRKMEFLEQNRAMEGRPLRLGRRRHVRYLG